MYYELLKNYASRSGLIYKAVLHGALFFFDLFLTYF